MFPRPIPALVIRYLYLWRQEYRQGKEEGVKDRPCAVVMTTHTDDRQTVVLVLPITHTPPADIAMAVEIPSLTKRRLGLDGARSWIVLSEANRFIWPGPDLRMTDRNDPSSVAYGLLPSTLFNEVRDKLANALSQRLLYSQNTVHCFYYTPPRPRDDQRSEESRGCGGRSTTVRPWA